MRSEHEEVLSAIADRRPTPGGWYRAPCPFCIRHVGKPDRKASLGVSASTGIYSCFRCGESGRLPEPPDPAAAQRYRRDVPSNGPTLFEPPEGYYPIAREPARSSEAFADARAYLASRGVSDAMANDLGIGACDDGKWSGRVIVPLMTSDFALWLGWVGRIWVKSGPVPYLYPAGMTRGLYLYNHDALREESDDPVLVVEGVFDALALWPCGVAVLGKPSHGQVEALAAARRPVSIVLDGDAWREGWALAQRLRFDGQRAGFVRLPPRTDPDEVPRDWLLDKARRSLEETL